MDTKRWKETKNKTNLSQRKVKSKFWKTREAHGWDTRPCTETVYEIRGKHKDTRPAYTPVYGPCMRDTRPTHARVWTVYREEKKTKDTRPIIHARV